MVYHGHIKDGKVVLEDPVALPEGATVRVEVVTERMTDDGDSAAPPSLRDILLKFAGSVKGLPPDASSQHDHYLYGTPKHE